MCNARDPAASGDDRSVAGGTACADKTLKGQKGDVTALLSQWSSADRPFIDDLYRLVKDDLHRIAAACMRREGPDHILQATALVNEAYLKLVEPHAPYKDRSHFFGNKLVDSPGGDTIEGGCRHARPPIRRWCQRCREASELRPSLLESSDLSLWAFRHGTFSTDEVP